MVIDQSPSGTSKSPIAARFSKASAMALDLGPLGLGLDEGLQMDLYLTCFLASLTSYRVRSKTAEI